MCKLHSTLVYYVIIIMTFVIFLNLFKSVAYILLDWFYDMKVAPKPMHLGERSYPLRELGFTEHIQCLLGKFKENKITEQMQKRHKISICGLAGTEQKSKKGNLPQIICRYTNLKKSFFF